MRSFPRFALLIGLALISAPALPAQDLTPPYVANPPANLTVPFGTAQSSVKLKKTFALTGVGPTPIVRFNTTQGSIDFTLRPDVAPLTVTNFLNYVNRGAYTNTFVHRSVPNFVIQGGGYSTETFEHIDQDAPVKNEHSLPGALQNTVGTISMARQSAPDTATSEWFFNTVDNPYLDDEAQTNGGYTVFGRVINNSFDTVSRIAAIPTFAFQSPYGQLPLVNYTTDNFIANVIPTNDNFVYVLDAAQVPLVPKTAGAPSVLKLSVLNTNPGLVAAALNGYTLNLVYTAGATGSATITVKAKSPAGTKAKAIFNVSVQ